MEQDNTIPEEQNQNLEEETEQEDGFFEGLNQTPNQETVEQPKPDLPEEDI